MSFLDKRMIIFRKGASNQWQDILNKDQILKIEQNFSKLMKKF